MQMRLQTYPIHQAVYINWSNAVSLPERWDYRKLFSEMDLQNRVTFECGESMTLHENYMKALRAVDWTDFDLFLKIDDDDIYRPSYVQNIVESYLDKNWDFSGSYAFSKIEGKELKWGIGCKSLGLKDSDISLGVPEMMPGTYAFSQKGMRLLEALPNFSSEWEDVIWRQILVSNATIHTFVRPDMRDYIYNIHGENVSNSKTSNTPFP